ncbi:hypothetical protein BJ138DRAFT_1182309 [Hygrophoropsis aurantiaca]|uniref:Uncharacterized protein n=1 Tax=Hygrophoropsis aurantiaca TaxID=72124 RepID=A0ACB8A4D4_9AGAM|nr:hypothetical protein BJ138DRAFT_1182309 [Hygrophoropsis aurantiaca]
MLSNLINIPLALSLAAAMAHAKCNLPINGNTWSFNVYNGPDCEPGKSTHRQQFWDNHGAFGCYDISKHVGAVVSASYYGQLPLTVYSEYGCKGKKLFKAKEHHPDWLSWLFEPSTYWVWSDNEIATESRGIKSFYISNGDVDTPPTMI